SVGKAEGKLDGTLNRPHVVLRCQPQHIYYLSEKNKHALELNGGELLLSDTETGFTNVVGKLGSGVFQLNGKVDTNPKAPTNLKISGKNIDLANVNLAMSALKIHSPLLAKSVLTGTIKDVELSAAAPPKYVAAEEPGARGRAAERLVDIAMVAHPQDIVFEPLGPSHILHVKSGTVTYKNDRLDLAEVDVSSGVNAIHTSLIVDKLSADPNLVALKVKTHGLSLADLDACLGSPKSPAALRTKYHGLLKQAQLHSPVGIIKGQFEAHAKKDLYVANGWMTLQNVGATVAGYSVNSINGSLNANDEMIQFGNITGAMSKSTFSVNGDVSNYSSQAERQWKIMVLGAADLPEVISALKLSTDAAVHVVSSVPLSVRLRLAGPETDLKGSYAIKVAPKSEFSLDSAIGLLKKPSGLAASLHGSAEIKSGTIVLPDSVIDVAGREAYLSGSVQPKRPMPIVALKVSLPSGTNIKELVALLPEKADDSSLKDIGGEISGDIELRGPINIPEMKG
ncbi:MAG TPA: hypothetical protein V6C72_09690, partial [Chroococcales cyanobacterium]